MNGFIMVKTPKWDEWARSTQSYAYGSAMMAAREVNLPVETVVQALADLAGLRFTEAQTTVVQEKFTIAEPKT